MWNKVAAISSGLLLSTLATAADPRIEASKAYLYVGKSVMACGTLAEINHLPNRHYMNFLCTRQKTKKLTKDKA